MEHASRRRATSQDVAKEAGVSRTTVSYILNNTPHQSIPDATRQRVLEAAARLRYTPSASARTLRRGHSDVVLFLLPDWPIGHAIAAVTEQLAQHLLPHGLTLVSHTHLRERPLDDVWRALTPAAVIRVGEFGPVEDEQLRQAQIEVLVEVGVSESSPTQLAFPIQRMGRMQAEHLAATGHQRIGYAAPSERRLSVFRDNRLHGVREACAELGLDLPDVRTIENDPASATEAIGQWRAAGVTGVCAYNDEIAMILLAGARRAGVRVPDDLAVIGTDNMHAAAFTDPPLTTVTIDACQVAAQMANHVIVGLTGTGTRGRIPSSVLDVVVRESA
ncbi:LacI family DNA-binding transcriptional regulator [Actinoplanes sp. NPDC051851]|uniref:LacI family DNA-binding transcriptional regulator n=1 Tax=Actinoplanes sp. NPDC051851 TaxID=3154753 RepID=UPI0034234C27